MQGLERNPIFYGTPEPDVSRPNCVGCQSVHRFGIWNRRGSREQYEYPTTFSQYFAFLRAPRKCLNFHLKLLCHGRGREFESRRPRHTF